MTEGYDAEAWAKVDRVAKALYDADACPNEFATETNLCRVAYYAKARAAIAAMEAPAPTLRDEVAKHLREMFHTPTGVYLFSTPHLRTAWQEPIESVADAVLDLVHRRLSEALPVSSSEKVRHCEWENGVTAALALLRGGER